MKILVLSTHLDGGGAFKAAYNLFTNLKKLNIQSSILNLNVKKNIIDNLIFKFNIFIDIFLRKVIIRPSNPIFHSSSLLNKYSASDIDKLDFDVVFIHWCSNGLISPNEISKLNVPYILFMHDSWFSTGFEHHPLKNNFSKNFFDNILFEYKSKAVNNASGIVFPSIWQKEIFSTRYDLKMPIEIIPNVVEDNYKLNSPDILNNTFVVCLIGQRLFNNVSKGGDLLASVISRLSSVEKNINFKFIIIGKISRRIPVYLHNYDNICIEQKGELTHNEIIDVLTNSHVFLNLSRFENLSTTNLEACYCNKPIIAFDVGGNSEMIIDDYNGFLCKPFDCNLVVRKLLLFCHGDIDIINFGRNSKSIFDSKFSKNVVLNKVLSFARSVVIK